MIAVLLGGDLIKRGLVEEEEGGEDLRKKSRAGALCTCAHLKLSCTCDVREVCDTLLNISSDGHSGNCRAHALGEGDREEEGGGGGSSGGTFWSLKRVFFLSPCSSQFR